MPNSRKTHNLMLLALLALGLSSACGKERKASDVGQTPVPGQGPVPGQRPGPGQRPRPGQQQQQTDAINDPNLSYKFVLTEEGGEPRLKVTLSFVMPRDEMSLQVPWHEISTKLPGGTARRKSNLFDRLEALSVNNGVLSPGESQGTRKLKAPQGEKVEISYSVRSYSEDNEAKTESFDTAVIADDYFNFVGYMVLIFPSPWQGLNKPREIKLEWEVPSDFRVLNSFGAVNDKIQTIIGSISQIFDSVYIGGSKIQVIEKEVRGRPVAIALNGTWPKIPDQEWADVTTRLLATQRSTWNDDDFPYFLVTMWAKGKSCVGVEDSKYKGRAHYDSFRSKYAPQCAMVPRQIILMSHEMMHMWLAEKIKIGEKDNGNDGRWLTEGWTDYYGRLLAYRSGLIKLEEYFETLNSKLNKYQNSPDKNVTLEELVTRYDDKGDAKYAFLFQIPYQQGEIMAMRLNQKIKENTAMKYSLDNVMRDLLVIANAAPGGEKTFKVAEIAAAVNKYAGAGVFEREYEKVENGGLFLPPKLGKCATPEPVGDNNAYIYKAANEAACKEWLKN